MFYHIVTPNIFFSSRQSVHLIKWKHSSQRKSKWSHVCSSYPAEYTSLYIQFCTTHRWIIKQHIIKYIYKYTICCVIGPLYWNSWGARAKKHVENLYTGMVESMTDITSLVFKISRASEYKRGPQMVLVVFLVFGSKCLNNEKVDQQSSLSPKIK